MLEDQRMHCHDQVTRTKQHPLLARNWVGEHVHVHQLNAGPQLMIYVPLHPAKSQAGIAC